MTPVRDILLAVTFASHVGLTDLRGPRRNASLVRARFLAAWLLRRLSGRSYPEIGMDLGGRDHSTIMNAVRRVDADIAGNGPLLDAMLEMVGSMDAGCAITDRHPEATRGEPPRPGRENRADRPGVRGE